MYEILLRNVSIVNKCSWKAREETPPLNQSIPTDTEHAHVPHLRLQYHIIGLLDCQLDGML